MKKLKVIAIVSGFLTLVQLLWPVILGIIFKIGVLGVKNAGAIGVIGGADGPTSVYVAGKIALFAVALRYLFLFLSALAFAVSVVLLFVKSRKDSE